MFEKTEILPLVMTVLDSSVTVLDSSMMSPTTRITAVTVLVSCVITWRVASGNKVLEKLLPVVISAET